MLGDVRQSQKKITTTGSRPEEVVSKLRRLGERLAGARRWGDRETGRCRLVDTEFQFCKVKS